MKDNYSKRERVSRMRHFVACVLMLFGAGLSTAFAQSYISGTVTDAQGNPLVGVNVIVKGDHRGHDDHERRIVSSGYPPGLMC